MSVAPLSRRFGRIAYCGTRATYLPLANSAGQLSEGAGRLQRLAGGLPRTSRRAGNWNHAPSRICGATNCSSRQDHQKEELKRDGESQALENVVAVVFAQYYLAEFVATHPDY